MNLHDYVMAKIEALYQDYDSISADNSVEIERLKTMQSQLEESPENLCYILPADFENVFDVSNPKFSKKLNEVQRVLEGIYERKLLMKLSKGQTQFIESIISGIGEKIGDLEERNKYYIEHPEELADILSSLEEKIAAYEELEAKIGNPDDMRVLTLDDFSLFEEITNDPNFSMKDKKALLKQIIEYNEGVLQNHKEVALADKEDVNKLFSSFSVSDKVLGLIKKNEGEVLSHINLDRARDVLLYMKEQNLLSVFSPDALLAIAVYGDVLTLQKRYESLDSIPKSLFSIPSVWINNVSSSRKGERRGYRGKNVGKTNGSPLSSAAHRVSYEDLVENERFLQSIGLDVSIMGERGLTALQQPTNRVVENYHVLKDLGLFEGRDMSKFPSAVFAASNIFDRANRFIELGLLGKKGFNYVSNYPSAFNFFAEEAFAKLYDLKQNSSEREYYDTITSDFRGDTLKTDVRLAKGDFSLGEDLETFVFERFVDLSDKIPNAKLYDEVLRNSSYGVNHDILDDESIRYLDARFGTDDDLRYVIGGQIVSRAKVLHNYSTLVSEGYQGEEALLYSTVSGMYLTEDSFEKVAGDIHMSYQKGGNSDAVSKTI